jgi:hypothetical protein
MALLIKAKPTKMIMLMQHMITTFNEKSFFSLIFIPPNEQNNPAVMQGYIYIIIAQTA